MLARTLTELLDVVEGQIEYLQTGWQFPHIIDLVVAETQLLQVVQTGQLFDAFLEQVSTQVQFLEVLESSYLRDFDGFLVGKSERHEFLRILDFRKL
jgi:hypothetical protein